MSRERSESASGRKRRRWSIRGPTALRQDAKTPSIGIVDLGVRRSASRSATIDSSGWPAACQRRPSSRQIETRFGWSLRAAVKPARAVSTSGIGNWTEAAALRKWNLQFRGEISRALLERAAISSKSSCSEAASMHFWMRASLWEGRAHGRQSADGVADRWEAESDSAETSAPSTTSPSPPMRQMKGELGARDASGFAASVMSRRAGTTDPRRCPGTSKALCRRKAVQVTARVTRSLRSEFGGKGNELLSHQPAEARRRSPTGHPSSPTAQSQSLSGWIAMFWPAESRRSGPKSAAKLPAPQPRKGWCMEKDRASICSAARKSSENCVLD